MQSCQGFVEIKLSVSLRREKTIPYVAISYKCTHIQENIQHENTAIREVLIIARPGNTNDTGFGTIKVRYRNTQQGQNKRNMSSFKSWLVSLGTLINRSETKIDSGPADSREYQCSLRGSVSLCQLQVKNTDRTTKT